MKPNLIAVVLRWELEMLKRATWALVGMSIFFCGCAQAEMNATQMQGPASETIDISAQAVPGNRLSVCRVTGQVILWVSRRVAVLDEMRENLGAIEAGLAQFGAGTKLEGCVPDGAGLDLSNQLVNFLIADDQALRNGGPGRGEVGALASQLAQNFYHLAEQEGTLIPLMHGLEMSTIGSVSYQFTIVLIRNAKFGCFDAVIHRETLRTKFAPRLGETDRRLSRLKWSSIQ